MAKTVLQKKSRAELLELLFEQGKQKEALQAELNAANEKLRDRTLRQNQAGTMAQAALALNGVYEAADAAAAQYVENLRRASIEAFPDTLLADARAQADRILADARAEAAAIVAEAHARARALENKSAKKPGLLGNLTRSVRHSKKRSEAKVR